MDSASIVTLSGLVIGLVYGSVGLLSGFCLMSGMRGWLAEGDGRLIRTYALAIGVAVAVTQLLVASGFVDISKSIYLQPSFSVPVMFFGGLLFGYGMVLSNGCGSRALVLLGRGNLRSFVVVVVLAIFAQMTLKGLIAPPRIAMVAASQTTTTANAVPALLAGAGLSATAARMLAASIISAALIIFALAHPAFRRSPGQIAAGLVAVDGIDAEFRHRHRVRRVCGQPRDGAGDRTLPSRRLPVAAPHAALRRRCGADGRRRCDGLWLFGRARADRLFDAGARIADRVCRNLARHRRRIARRAARASGGGGLIRRLRHDPDFRCQRPVYWTLVGDFHQSLALIGIERALD
jgi:uncharacterized membrane protein YedE/YeeE